MERVREAGPAPKGRERQAGTRGEEGFGAGRLRSTTATTLHLLTVGGLLEARLAED
jgi:hypothetical protein